MLGGMVSLCSLAMCLRTISEYRKRSPQMRQCHWSRAKMYGRHSELFGSSLGSGILIISRRRGPQCIAGSCGVKRITGLDWPLLALAGCLLALSAGGAIGVTHFDDPLSEGLPIY